MLSVFILAKPEFRCESCLDDLYAKSSDETGRNFTENFVNKFYDTFYEQKQGKCGTEFDFCKISSEAGYSPESTNNSARSIPESLETCCYGDTSVPIIEKCDSDKIISTNYSVPTSCGTYIYDDSVFESTVVSDFDLVCANSWLMDLSTSIYFLGFGIGGMIGSYLNDKHGRRPVLLISSLLNIIATFSLGFVNNFVLFMILRSIQSVEKLSEIVSVSSFFFAIAI